jgi:predicted Zn finger-like uncharacterized protein
MILRCPSCDAKIRVQDEFAGKKTRCPHCQEVFRANPPEEADLAEAVVVDEPRSPRPAESPRRRRRHDDEGGYDGKDDIDLARRRSMPGSVIIAVVAMGIMLAMELTLSLLVLAVGNLPPDRLGGVLGRMAVSVVLGGLVLWGLIVGHRLAWQWGRILGLLGALLMLLAGVVTLTAGPPQNSSLAKLVIGGISLFVSACLFTIVFSLASRSAKIYFALRCPECGKFTSAAADFFFNKAKCKNCGEIW